MKYKFLFGLALSALVSVSATVFAQEPVVMLHHNGEQTPFTGIDGLKKAYEAAVDNDTIYLPGGTFNQPSDYAKGIHIYGTGILPDSTKTTSITTLNGQTRLRTGADNFHLEGVQGNSSIRFGFGKDIVSQVRIIGCKFAEIAKNNSDAQFTGVQIIQCVITGSLDLSGIRNSVVKNSIISGESMSVVYSDYNLFENNVMISNNYYEMIAYTNYNIYRNNVIIHGRLSNGIYCSANSYYNNINIPMGTDNAANENPYTVAQESIFVNYENVTFSFDQDYHLQNPELYMGTDGTQVGIYGGEYAWPETTKAVLPSNPHIRAFNAASNTDENGMLQINVQVGAQE